MNFYMGIARACDQVVQVVYKFRCFIPFEDVMHDRMPTLKNDSDAHLPNVIPGISDDGISSAFSPFVAAVQFSRVNIVETFFLPLCCTCRAFLPSKKLVTRIAALKDHF